MVLFFHRLVASINKQSQQIKVTGSYQLSFFLFLIFSTLKSTLYLLLIIEDKYLLFFIYNYVVNFIFLVIFLPLVASRRVLFCLCYGVQLVFMFICAGYYMYFDSYLSVVNFIQLFKEGLGAIDSTLSIKGIGKLFFLFIDLPFFVFLWRNIKRGNPSFYGVFHYKILIVFSVLTVVMIELVNFKMGRSFVNFLQRPHKTEEVMVKRYGVIVNSIFDLKYRSNESELEKNIKYGRVIANKGSADKNNVIIIQVESLDSSIVTTKHNGRYVTPFFNRLRGKAICFPYCLIYHDGGGTSDAEFATLNGVESFNKFAAFKMSGYSYPNSMFKPFNEAGFDSIIFHVNRGDFFNRTVAYRKMEATAFFDYFAMNIPPEQQQRWGATDEFLFGFSFNTLKQQQGNSLYYLITVSSHSPFQVVNDYYSDAHFDDIDNTIVRNYFLSMSYVDKVTEQFVDKVTKEFPGTFILIFGDHTPGKIEYKGYRSSRMFYNHNKFEFVPLYIITPDNKAYYEQKMAVSLLDIAPTVLNISGIPYSIRSFGEDLLERKWQENLLKNGNRYKRDRMYDRINKLRKYE